MRAAIAQIAGVDTVAGHHKLGRGSAANIAGTVSSAPVSIADGHQRSAHPGRTRQPDPG